MTTLQSPPPITNRPASIPAPSDPALFPIIDKVQSGQRLTFEDGTLLYHSPDIWSVCNLAHLVRRRLHGQFTFFNRNRHLNYTNICALSCSFCAFYSRENSPNAYEYSLAEIEKEAQLAVESGATEIHIVGGLHPRLPFDYYLDLCRTIRKVSPDLHIKAFTAVEIVHFARIAKRGRQGYQGIKSILQDLIEAGLCSLPGGGAEVFDDRIHDKAYKGKIRAGQWLDVHRAAHELGLNSNATMLYGHIESREERLQHFIQLREHQDMTLKSWASENGVYVAPDGAVNLTGPDSNYRNGLRLPTQKTCSTGWFQTIIPLPFFPDDSALENLPAPTGLENLRTLALARLMLDNFPHVKAFWIMQTLEMAQLMLLSGADDIDGTVVWYDITKQVGEGTHQETSVNDLKRAIREAGFIPVERDSLYNPIA